MTDTKRTKGDALLCYIAFLFLAAFTGLIVAVVINNPAREMEDKARYEAWRKYEQDPQSITYPEWKLLGSPDGRTKRK